MKFRCKHCNTLSKAEEWNKETEKQCGEIDKGIEEGYKNSNYYYICPICNNRMYKKDWTQEVNNRP